MLENLSEPALYQFGIQAGDYTYTTSFTVSEDGVETACSCNTGNGPRNCWHVNYILAGRKRRIIGNETNQTALIHSISKIPDGTILLEKAKGKSIKAESCRRCSSPNVIILKDTLYGKFISLLKPDGHIFYCKSCKWSW